MALYAIGDFHLALGQDKPMDIFGDKWINHAEKLIYIYLFNLTFLARRKG